MEELTFAVARAALYGTYQPAATRKPKASALLVHGFNSNVTEWGHLQARLAEAGIASLAFDQRGFGGSGGPPGRTGPDRSLEDIRAAAAVLAGRAPRVAMGVVGHSLGGAWSLHAVAAGMPFRAAAVAHAPDAVLGDLDIARSALLRVLGPSATRRETRGHPPRILTYKSRARHLFVSKEHQRLWDRPDVLVRPMNLANVADFARSHASRWAAQVRIPTLVVASEADTVVRRRRTLAVYHALAGERELLEHRGGHACFRDLDGDKVNAAVVAWLARHLAGGA